MTSSDSPVRILGHGRDPKHASKKAESKKAQPPKLFQMKTTAKKSAKHKNRSTLSPNPKKITVVVWKPPPNSPNHDIWPAFIKGGEVSEVIFSVNNRASANVLVRRLTDDGKNGFYGPLPRFVVSRKNPRESTNAISVRFQAGPSTIRKENLKNYLPLTYQGNMRRKSSRNNIYLAEGLTPNINGSLLEPYVIVSSSPR